MPSRTGMCAGRAGPGGRASSVGMAGAADTRGGRILHGPATGGTATLPTVMPSVRVKVCCMSSLTEAALALSHGADAIGLVSRMPSGPGVIDEETIASIARAAPRSVGTFLLTSLRDGASIVDQARRCGVNTVQIV